VLGGLQCQPQPGTYFVRLGFRLSRISSRPTPLSVTVPARCRAGNAWWFGCALQGLFFQCASHRRQHFFGLLCGQHRYRAPNNALLMNMRRRSLGRVNCRSRRAWGYRRDPFAQALPRPLGFLARLLFEDFTACDLDRDVGRAPLESYRPRYIPPSTKSVWPLM